MLKTRLLPVLFACLLIFTGCKTASVVTEVETFTATAIATETEVEPEPEFYILYTDGEVDFTNAPKAYINIYRWSGEYTPTAYAQAVFKEADGFYVRMTCEESDPLAVNTEFNAPIYQDSCMEFFADYMPSISKGKYINVEMNSNGAFLCYLCVDVPNGDYGSIADVSSVIPTVTATKTADTWTVDLHMPLETIKNAYGRAEITLGSVIKCNFYKCGDKTAQPHYGTWNEIINDTPNFHLPQYFAEVEIKAGS